MKGWIMLLQETGLPAIRWHGSEKYILHSVVKE